MEFRIFVQARMSSERFPGKMLTPFRGRPLIAHVLDGLSAIGARAPLMVLTSDESSDDPLADFVETTCGVGVFRGDLHNVAGRFQNALRRHPCDWFVRISGDSPLIDASLVERMIGFIDNDMDIVTNVRRRTFPPGQSVECLRTAAFASLDTHAMTDAQREHVTPVFYEQPHWKLRSIVCTQPDRAQTRMVVDTPDDLESVEALAASEAASVSFGSLCEIEAA